MEIQSEVQSRSFVKIIGLVLVVFFLGAGLFMLSSEGFERNKPVIKTSLEPSWNLNGDFFIYLSDDTGIKDYRVSYEGDLKESFLPTKMAPFSECPFVAKDEENGICLAIEKPNIPTKNIQSLNLIVEVTDKSKWNFFSGNKTLENIAITIDTKKPQLAVVSNSYRITQGGSALVIFRVEDENLEKIRISNGENEFIPQPFYKEGYYISLLAWPKNNLAFNAKIYASDTAGNVSVAPINFFAVKKEYRKSNISLTDSFIDGKISSLVEEIGDRSLESFVDKLSIFKYINEDIRQYSEKHIMQAGATFSLETIEDFQISAFSPLKNAAVTASFGDHRTFIYQGEVVGYSNHMGLDLASVKQAPIILSNPGEVIVDEFIGIDGNALVIHHGLGLSSLYAHLTKSLVDIGDKVERGTIIGNTGNTGLSLGDHLHFGVLVQGYEVWTAEWMDSKWIENNITKVIVEAKGIINSL
ncbi:M23 family metallopeptidase [Helicobacter mesocricetorum]|uniref:M23 family metallopeptidase n=1 Tax=Helicobacter mesocricetorum TaxID=87012 RepID=UPI000CF0E74B|nr:M23 family metallopeptidase [Helicobacter mesocricetorum]